MPENNGRIGFFGDRERLDDMDNEVDVADGKLYILDPLERESWSFETTVVPHYSISVEGSWPYKAPQLELSEKDTHDSVTHVFTEYEVTLYDLVASRKPFIRRVQRQLINEILEKHSIRTCLKRHIWIKCEQNKTCPHCDVEDMKDDVRKFEIVNNIHSCGIGHRYISQTSGNCPLCRIKVLEDLNQEHEARQKDVEAVIRKLQKDRRMQNRSMAQKRQSLTHRVSVAQVPDHLL